MDPAYRPIDCGFHDELLALATRRVECEIAYLAEDGGRRVARGRIEDVYSRDGAEFLRLADGRILRLDRLLAADGKSPRPGADGGPATPSRTPPPEDP